MRKSTLFAFAAMIASAGIFTANAAEQVPYTLTPAAGPATDLMTISIDFTANRNVAFYENNPMPVAVLENTTTGTVYNCQDAVRNTFAVTEGCAYNLTFIAEDADDATPITEPGDYTLTIRAFGLESGEGDDVTIDDLPQITANYTITYPVKYVITPEPGKATNLTTITVDFPETKAVTFYENNRFPVAVLENTTTGVSYVCEEPDRDTKALTEGIAYSFTFVEVGESAPAEITAVGNYKLTIRAMYLDAEEEGADYIDLPPITAAYEIVYPVNYTLNPAPGVATDLQGITIEFADFNVAFVENMRPNVAVLENTTTGKIYTCVEPDRNTFAQSEGPSYILNFLEEDADDETATVLPITEPGEYVLTIRGLYTEGSNGEIEEWLPVILANYTIEYPIQYYFTDPLGEVVQNLKTVTIEFPNNRNVGYYELVRPAFAVLENTTTGDVYSCKEPDQNTHAESDGAVYMMTFINDEDDTTADDYTADDITTPGNYVLTIRGLYLENEDGENVDLPIIVKNYTIEYPYEYYLTPADGATVQNLKTVSLEFPTTNEVKFYEFVRPGAASLENLSTGTSYLCQEPDRDTFAQTDGIVYSFTFIPVDSETEEAVDIIEPGEYMLTIRGLYISGEQEESSIDLPNIIAHYTMGFPVNYELDPINGSQPDDLETITLTFPDNRNVAFYENNKAPVATLENVSLDILYNCQEAERDTFAMTEGVAFKLNFIENESEEQTPIAEDGIYNLTIKALCLVDENDEPIFDLPIIEATYYIASSGVKAAQLLGGEENDVYNVYSINGLQVIRNGNADALNTLNRGLYIINGKKVIIRK